MIAVPELSDKEFDDLKKYLEITYLSHEALQRAYKQRTGRRWIMPCRILPVKEIVDEVHKSLANMGFRSSEGSEGD